MMNGSTRSMGVMIPDEDCMIYVSKCQIEDSTVMCSSCIDDDVVTTNYEERLPKPCNEMYNHQIISEGHNNMHSQTLYSAIRNRREQRRYHKITKKSRMQQYTTKFHLMLLLIITLQLITITSAQDRPLVVDNTDESWGDPTTLVNDAGGEAQVVAVDNSNPLNQFCGMTYEEAHQFCYLPPEKSLPCPNGAEVDCPFDMPCWEIKEECVDPSAAATNDNSVEEPIISGRSDNPSDHNFCGLGYNNLFQW